MFKLSVSEKKGNNADMIVDSITRREILQAILLSDPQSDRSSYVHLIGRSFYWSVGRSAVRSIVWSFGQSTWSLANCLKCVKGAMPST